MQTWQQSSGTVGILGTARLAPQGRDSDVFNNHAWATEQGIVAAAGQNPAVGIANPAASGKDVYIDKIVISNSVAATIQMSQGADNFLGTDLGVTNNKNLGAAAPNNHVRSGVAGGTAAVQDGTVVPANTPIVITYATPVFVPAGRSYIVSAAPAGVQTLTVAFEGREY